MTTRLARSSEALRRVSPWVWDVGFGVTVAVFNLAVLLPKDANDALFRKTDALAMLVTVGASLSVIWRRRRPLEALVVGTALVAALTFPNYETGGAPTVIVVLLYAVAHYDTPVRSQVGLVAAVIGLGVAALNRPPDLKAADVASTVVVFVVAWIFGNAMRRRGEGLLRQLAEAERRAEIAAERNARAVAEERLRIAQELHDVVAHSMSVIAVQAGVGAHVLDTDPGEARKALENISATSRSTLTEMRRLLGVLRAQDGTRAVSEPAPGLDDLPALVRQVEAAGLPVSLSVRGEAVAPPGVTLSAYRIVQEALTNVIKHAGPARAEVSVCLERGALTVDVVDDGRGLAAHGAVTGTGHGITGMRERVAVYGGTLVAGGRPGGGFAVHARIPFEEHA